MLSDRSIRKAIRLGDIEIKPAPEDIQFQPVSVDLRLGECGVGNWWIDDDNKTFVLRPGQFALASTAEAVKLSCNIAGTVHGKSTWARRGLQVHAAGLVDPGFEGQLTLELYCMNPRGLYLTQGTTIAQISFCYLSCSPERAYGAPGLDSHYQGQTGPTPAHGESW